MPVTYAFIVMKSSLTVEFFCFDLLTSSEPDEISRDILNIFPQI